MRYRTTPNMYVWDNLHLAVPLPPQRRAARAVETGRRDRQHDRAHPGVEAEVRVEGKDEAAATAWWR